MVETAKKTAPLIDLETETSSVRTQERSPEGSPETDVKFWGDAHSPPVHHPADIRSRLAPRQSAAAFKEEARTPSVVSIRGGDANKDLARRNWKNGHDEERDRAQNTQRRQETVKDTDERAKCSRRLIDNNCLTPKEMADNAYAPSPRFHLRCDFCTGSHCSRFMRGSTVTNCPRLSNHVTVAATRRLCDYRRCKSATSHHTAACPELHARCPRCGCRGHSLADGCDMRNAEVMEGLRADFEECAGIGLLTKRRTKELAWGFYPYAATAPRGEPVVDYGRLSRMPVLQAIGLLQALLDQAKEEQREEQRRAGGSRRSDDPEEGEL